MSKEKELIEIFNSLNKMFEERPIPENILENIRYIAKCFKYVNELCDFDPTIKIKNLTEKETSEVKRLFICRCKQELNTIEIE